MRPALDLSRDAVSRAGLGSPCAALATIPDGSWGRTDQPAERARPSGKRSPTELGQRPIAEETKRADEPPSYYPYA